MSVSKVALVLLLGWSGAPASAQEKPLQPKAEVSDAEIERWVQELGSENFDEREIAIQKILDLGTRAQPFLEKAVKESRNSEVRWNAKRLIREIREAERRHPAPPRNEPWDRGGRVEDLLRQMERQQEDLRRMLEEQFRDWPQPDTWRWEPFEWSDPQWGTGSGDLRHSFSLRQGPDGVRLEISETVEGKEQKKVYEAESMEQFREKFPEIAEKYGIGGDGRAFRFRIGGSPRLRPLFPPRESFVLQPTSPLHWGDRLGVEIERVEPSLGAFLGLPGDVGLLVRRVEEGSLAKKMGIRERDVLVSINGYEIRGSQTILDTLKKLEVGAEVTVELFRSGEGKIALKGTKEKISEATPKPLEKLPEGPK